MIGVVMPDLHLDKMNEINNGKQLDQIIIPIHNYLTKNKSCTVVVLVFSTQIIEFITWTEYQQKYWKILRVPSVGKHFESL